MTRTFMCIWSEHGTAFGGPVPHTAVRVADVPERGLPEALRQGFGVAFGGVVVKLPRFEVAMYR